MLVLELFFTLDEKLDKTFFIVQMQVDSPCHSPKMTPASSLSNLNDTSAAAAHTLDQVLI